jgi:thiamine kinase-like enzyme
MKTDEIIDWIDILENENKRLRVKNNHLNQQLRRYRESLESVLNILEPEQLRIIHKDICYFNHIKTNQNA